MGLLISCSSSEVETDFSRLGHDYFPMKVGSYRIYDIDETHYFLTGPQQRLYQLRESVVDSTIISDSEVLYTVHRETKESDEENWSLDSVWTASVSTQRAIVTENNIPFIKMVFPIENGLTWDGNSYNARIMDEYVYDNSLSDTSVMENAYSELWTVIQSDEGENFLGRNDRMEIYAREVGLIIKNVHIWNYCQDCSSEKQIVAGRDLTQVLIEYGED